MMDAQAYRVEGVAARELLEVLLYLAERPQRVPLLAAVSPPAAPRVLNRGPRALCPHTSPLSLARNLRALSGQIVTYC